MPKINSDLILNEIIAGYGQRGAPPKIPGEFQCCYSNMLSLWWIVAVFDHLNQPWSWKCGLYTVYI